MRPPVGVAAICLALLVCIRGIGSRDACAAIHLVPEPDVGVATTVLFAIAALARRRSR